MTGRRLGSFRQLRWKDIDFKTDTILWRAEADKKRREWKVPMPQALREELRSFRVKLGGAFGGLLFPSESDPAIPLRRDLLAKWLQQAERRAGLRKLDGSLWHAYRRAWATRRKSCRSPTLPQREAGAMWLRCFGATDSRMKQQCFPWCRTRAKFLTGSRGETDPAICKCMERTGIEPATSWLQTRRSPS
jgi:hypothetical protein